MDNDAFLETRTVVNITRLQEAWLISTYISVFGVTFVVVEHSVCRSAKLLTQMWNMKPIGHGAIWARDLTLQHWWQCMFFAKYFL